MTATLNMSGASAIKPPLEVTTDPIFPGKENSHQQISYEPVVE
jgi:hypothetical protein